MNSTVPARANFSFGSSPLLKIRVVAIGEDKDRWVTDGSKHYLKLLSRWTSFEIKTLPAPKVTSSLSPEATKKREAELLARELGKGTVIALSDSGKAMTSQQLARFLEKLQASSGGAITFLIGGPHGLHDSILSDADVILSLSPLTFSHQLVRLVLLEQLYRGLSILHGTAYHK